MIYRLKTDAAFPNASKPPVSADDMISVGEIVFNARPNRNPLEATIYVGRDPNGYGRVVGVPSSDLEPIGPIRAGDFERYLDYVLAGKVDLPTCVNIPPETGINTIACAGSLSCLPGIMHPRVPGQERGVWARVFVSHTQGGQLDGTGYAMLYRQIIYRSEEEGGAHYGDKPAIVSFAICQHAPVTGAGANPSRGWHPANCEKCGLNMSVDSGD